MILCTVCGNRDDLVNGTCSNCNATTRQRAVAYGVLRALKTGKDSIYACKMDKSREGLGVSDWFGLAAVLANRFTYTNTFYHKFPMLDISSPPDIAVGQFEFCTCSDVLEHVLPPVDRAFRGLFELLKPGGSVVLSVPIQERGAGVHEKYPNLYKFRIVDTHDGKYHLENYTKEGEFEIFHDLNFHGGPGSTLEMRVFSWSGFLAELERAGFIDFEIIENYPELGIPDRPQSGNVVVARKPFKPLR